MVKDKWGVKRKCGECVTAFYDMNNPNIICPKCGTSWTPNVAANQTVELVKPAKKLKKRSPSLEDLAIDTDELRSMNAQLVDDLYDDLLEEDYGMDDIRDVSEVLESGRFYND